MHTTKTDHIGVKWNKGIVCDKGEKGSDGTLWADESSKDLHYETW